MRFAYLEPTVRIPGRLSQERVPQIFHRAASQNGMYPSLFGDQSLGRPVSFAIAPASSLFSLLPLKSQVQDEIHVRNLDERPHLLYLFVACGFASCHCTRKQQHRCWPLGQVRLSLCHPCLKH